MTQVPPETLVPGNTLVTATPELGRALAITLARHSIRAMQGESEALQHGDGMPHPVTGNSNYDASAYTRVDAYTINISRMKAGKVVGTTTVVSRDGTTATATDTLTDANGRQINNIVVYDKQ
jgi:hypothetical protein